MRGYCWEVIAGSCRGVEKLTDLAAEMAGGRVSGWVQLKRRSTVIGDDAAFYAAQGSLLTM